MGERRIFTEEELDYSIREYKNGKSCIEIGKELGRDDSTIRRHLKKVNVYVNNINYCSEEELANIINDYNNNMSLNDLSSKYKRDNGYLITKLRSVGVYKDKNRKYTKEEIDFLIEKYSIGDYDSIFEKFPDLKLQTLYTKMSSLGITCGRKNFYTEYELEYIKNNYQTESLDSIYKHFNGRHSKDSIATKALRCFGYSKDDSWTGEENDILKNNYGLMPLDDVCKLLPNRSKEAIICHAKIFGIKGYYYNEYKWNKEQDEYLINNWEEQSDEEIGKVLGKKRMAIKTRRNYLGLYRCRKDHANYENINKLLRGQIYVWKKDSIEACDYKCVLTGSKDFQVHHLYPMCRIIDDMCNNPDYTLPDKELEDCSNDEILYIIECFKKEHDKQPLGVCVRKDIHELYHKLYGKYSNSINQWNRFVIDYKNGKYKSMIN